MRGIYGFFPLVGLAIVAILTTGCPTQNAELMISHPSHNYGTSETEFSFFVWVTGGSGSVRYTCTANQPWINLSRTSGTATSSNTANEVVVGVDRSDFDEGIYTGTVTVSAPGYPSKTFTVTAKVGLSSIAVSDTSHNFSFDHDTWSFDVWNDGSPNTLLEFTVAADAPWISVDPASGSSADSSAHQTIQVSIDRDQLQKASYDGTITVTSERGEEQDIAITARDPVPAVGLSATSLNFGAVETEITFNVYNGGEAGSTLDFTLSESAGWLTLLPTSGSSDSATDTTTIRATVDRSGLVKGQGYTTSINIAAPGAAPATVSVLLDVGEPELEVTTNVLDFGGTATQRTFGILNPGEAGSVLDFSVAAPSDSWITVQPATGSVVASETPETVTVTIDRSTMSKAAPKAFAPYRTVVGSGSDAIDVVVVGGTPIEMGRSIGELMADEIAANLASFQAMAAAAGISNTTLDEAWEMVSPFIDPQFLQELQGVSEGLASEGYAGRYQSLVRAHMIPVIESYSCSAIAVWGAASQSGHLFQIRNLDWELQSGAQDNPWIVVYHPQDGIPHANVGFAGMLGCITGISAKGIALSEVGDSPSGESPYDLDGEHFATLLRKILYDADNLTEALGILENTKRIKRYHYVFGDGKNEQRAVKIKAHAPETPPDDLIIYTDSDPNDPVIGDGFGIFEGVVFHAEGRDPIAYNHLTQNYGEYDAAKMVELSRSVATHGGSVLNAVYDATSLEMWVAFAEGADSEAYEREYVYVDLHEYFELPTEAEGSIQVTGDGGETETILVRARTPEAAIGLSANSHDFGLDENSWSFDVWNAGDPGTTLAFTVADDQPWISVSRTSGSSAGSANPVSVTVTLDRNLLAKTLTYDGAVTIATASGETQAIRILARYPEPSIVTSVASVDFGSSLEERTFQIWNGGDPSSLLEFDLATAEPWIVSVTPSTGSSTGVADKTTITVIIDRAVLAGTSGTVTGAIALTGDNAPAVQLPVTLQMLAATSDFTGMPLSVDVHDEVQFTDTSNPGTGDIVAWEWDFGDESGTSTEQHPTHEYEAYGEYTVSLTTTTEYGLQNTVTKLNYVRVEPQPATAQFAISDTTPDMFQLVNFTDKSDPGSGVITSWLWDFGDGYTSTAQNAVHTYFSHGTFTVTLRITTTFQSNITPASRTITVGQVLPDAEFSVDKKIVYTELDTLTFTDLSEIPGPWSERIATWTAWRGGIADMPTPWQANYSGEYWIGTHEADITDGLYYLFFDRGRYTCRLIERSKYEADPVDPDDPSPSWYANTEVKDSLVEVRVPSPLDTYCRYDDGLYDIERMLTVNGSYDGYGYIYYVLKLTSQKWVLDNGASEPPVNDPADNIWEHWLTIIVPENRDDTFRTAVLYIEGGDNTDPMPMDADPYLLEYAVQTGHVVAAVHQVPNQPIDFTAIGALSGHEIIAGSFNQFMATGDTFWPAVFPMAKSVVKAMTGVQQFLGGQVPGPYEPPENPIVINDFTLAGADIQAWAAWLAGAHDERVRALIPMAFDFINMYEQIGYQAGPFDNPVTPQLEFSEVWDPYTAAQFNVFDRMDPVSTLNGAFNMKRYRKRFERHMRDALVGSLGGPCAPGIVQDLSGFMYSRPPGQACHDPHYSLYSYLAGTVDAVFPVHPDIAALGYASYSAAVYDAAENGIGCPSQPSSPYAVTGSTRPLFAGSPYRMNLVVDAMIDYEELQLLNNIEGWLTAMVDPAFYGERYGDTTYWYSERGGRLAMPKCIVSSAGSAYYVPTSAQIYLADMNGQNYFRYIPNTDHYLNQTGNDNQNDYKDAFLTTLPWFKEFLDENGNPTVPFRWRLLREDLIELEWTELNIPTDLQVGLWTAIDWNNDFRLDPALRPDGPVWNRTPIGTLNPGYYVIDVAPHNYQYKSFFVELSYSNSNNEPVTYTSPGYVLPPVFPGVRPLPLADFEAEPLVVSVGQAVQFTDLSDEGLAPIVSWSWDFGDGLGTSSDANPAYAYSSPGQYTVSLTVTNADGSDTRIKNNYITVN